MNHQSISGAMHLVVAVVLASFAVGCQSRSAAHKSLPVPAQQPSAAASKWEKDIAAFEASDRTNAPPQGAILFTGSSSIRLWKSLARDFPDYQVINRGFGGSQISEVNEFVNRIVVPYRPRQIVFYCGGNDINAGKSPERVFADYKEFVALVHKTLPKTRIAYISVAPNPARWKQIEQVREANRLIADHSRTDKRLAFINVFPHMLDEDGLPKPDIFVADKLHMNEKGYSIWKQVVGEFLAGQPKGK